MSSVSAVNTLLGSTTSTTNSAIDVSTILAGAAGATTPAIDVTAAVAAAIYADRATERLWQAQQATLASQTTALTAIQTATTAINTDMQSLNSLTGPLSARTVTSSNTSAVTATAASGTVSGSHSVAVENVAVTGSWYSDLATSATAALPASSITITTAANPSNPTTITLGSGVNNLTQLAAAINADKLGVTASVVTDSSGSRLALISAASGSAADFTVSSPQTTTATSWTSPSLPTGSTLGVNTITISSGTGSPQTSSTITTATGDTYATLAASINALNLDVTASVVSDTNGSHLALTSTSGTNFTINEPAFGYTQAAAGADAKLTVDGVPITSASNKVTGAIDGVTLNLTGATTAAGVTLTVASDASQISTAITQLVTDYNTAIGLVNAQYTYSATTSSQGVLSGDPTVRALQNSLMQALNYVNTPASGTTSIATLSDLGISTSSDGTLTLDSTVLNSALVNNATDVQNFFEGASLNGFAASMTSALSNFTNAGNGAFTVDLNSISKTNADLTKHISDFESIYIANQQTVLTAMYTKAEVALQQLSTTMAQIQAMLGNNTKSGG